MTSLAGSVPVNIVDARRQSMKLSEAARDCRSAVERMLDLHGTSGFRSSNPLQRLWHDVAVGSRHPQLTGYLALEAMAKPWPTLQRRRLHHRSSGNQ